jgi:hypothetical protein
MPSQPTSDVKRRDKARDRTTSVRRMLDRRAYDRCCVPLPCVIGGLILAAAAVYMLGVLAVALS